ncbi:hypothetical protein [Rhodohalobacter sp. 8-1]|uniref:hypothetical protein n=1 Tax=Rhodohalobacter sp. 8-1 TaxID=3131972 RepID=UPI0030EEB82D
MITHLRNISVLTLITILLTGCSGTKTISTPQAVQPPEIDGNISDWDMQKSMIDRSDVADYYATYDEEFIYLYIDVKSPGHSQAMKQSGFIIYINSSEENRDQIGLAFPSGTFNLLRENPAEYEAFTTDQEWFQEPQNRERLESLESQIFDRVMIVERMGPDTNYGFVDKERLQIDGIEMSSGENRRLISIEMRVPLNSSSIYSLNGDQFWLGFEIDPPNFRIQNNDNTSSRRQQQGYGRGRATQGSSMTRMNMRQRMGQYRQWYHVDLSGE